VDSNPVVVGGRLYAGSGVSRRHKDTEVFCLDAEDGRVLWRLPPDLPAWGSAAPDGGEVDFGRGHGRVRPGGEPPQKRAGAVLCVDARTGRRRWRYDVSDGVLVQPAVDGRHLYFGARDGRCYCLRRDDGRPRWQAELGSPVVARPALVDNHLYVVA